MQAATNIKNIHKSTLTILLYTMRYKTKRVAMRLFQKAYTTKVTAIRYQTHVT
jgi:hypothetical protein